MLAQPDLEEPKYMSCSLPLWFSEQFPKISPPNNYPYTTYLIYGAMCYYDLTRFVADAEHGPNDESFTRRLWNPMALILAEYLTVYKAVA